MLYKDVKLTVEECLKKADAYFGEEIPRPKIRFDLKGKTAGQACFAKGWLRFNIQLGQYNEEDFLKTTVPHEVAHWVQRWKYGYNGVKPHGREWKLVMMQVFRLRPERCHRYDTSKTQTRKLRRYTYKCLCRTHEVTSIKHNRMRKGEVYACKRCGHPLKLSQPPKRGLISEELD